MMGASSDTLNMWVQQKTTHKKKKTKRDKKTFFPPELTLENKMFLVWKLRTAHVHRPSARTARRAITSRVERWDLEQPRRADCLFAGASRVAVCVFRCSLLNSNADSGWSREAALSDARTHTRAYADTCGAEQQDNNRCADRHVSASSSVFSRGNKDGPPLRVETGQLCDTSRVPLALSFSRPKEEEKTHHYETRAEASGFWNYWAV